MGSRLGAGKGAGNTLRSRIGNMLGAGKGAGSRLGSRRGSRLKLADGVTHRWMTLSDWQWDLERK